MTPEERFTKIENLLNAFMENLVRLEAAQVRNGQQIAKHSEQIAKQGEQIAKHDEQIGKNTDGIRDLIVVSRTVLTSIDGLREAQRTDREDWTAQMKRLQEVQASTEEKLNILVETVDRIIRRENGDHGSKR